MEQYESNPEENQSMTQIFRSAQALEQESLSMGEELAMRSPDSLPTPHI